MQIPLHLNPRLAKMFELLMTAKTEKEISMELQISRHTVHSQIRDVYAAFGDRSRLELMAIQIREQSNRQSPNDPLTPTPINY